MQSELPFDFKFNSIFCCPCFPHIASKERDIYVCVCIYIYIYICISGRKLKFYVIACFVFLLDW
jgi:hypothetical protein